MLRKGKRARRTSSAQDGVSVRRDPEVPLGRPFIYEPERSAGDPIGLPELQALLEAEAEPRATAAAGEGAGRTWQTVHESRNACLEQWFSGPDDSNEAQLVIFRTFLRLPDVPPEMALEQLYDLKKRRAWDSNIASIREVQTQAACTGKGGVENHIVRILSDPLLGVLPACELILWRALLPFQRPFQGSDDLAAGAAIYLTRNADVDVALSAKDAEASGEWLGPMRVRRVVHGCVVRDLGLSGGRSGSSVFTYMQARCGGTFDYFVPQLATSLAAGTRDCFKKACLRAVARSPRHARTADAPHPSSELAVGQTHDSVETSSDPTDVQDDGNESAQDGLVKDSEHQSGRSSKPAFHQSETLCDSTSQKSSYQSNIEARVATDQPGCTQPHGGDFLHGFKQIASVKAQQRAMRKSEKVRAGPRRSQPPTLLGVQLNCAKLDSVAVAGAHSNEGEKSSCSSATVDGASVNDICRSSCGTETTSAPAADRRAFRRLRIRASQQQSAAEVADRLAKVMCVCGTGEPEAMAGSDNDSDAGSIATISSEQSLARRSRVRTSQLKAISKMSEKLLQVMHERGSSVREATTEELEASVLDSIAPCAVSEVAEALQPIAEDQTAETSVLEEVAVHTKSSPLICEVDDSSQDARAMLPPAKPLSACRSSDQNNTEAASLCGNEATESPSQQSRKRFSFPLPMCGEVAPDGASVSRQAAASLPCSPTVDSPSAGLQNVVSCGSPCSDRGARKRFSFPAPSRKSSGYVHTSQAPSASSGLSPRSEISEPAHCSLGSEFSLKTFPRTGVVVGAEPSVGVSLQLQTAMSTLLKLGLKRRPSLEPASQEQKVAAKPDKTCSMREALNSHITCAKLAAVEQQYDSQQQETCDITEPGPEPDVRSCCSSPPRSESHRSVAVSEASSTRTTELADSLGFCSNKVLVSQSSRRGLKTQHPEKTKHRRPKHT